MEVNVLEVVGIDHALCWMRYAKQTKNDTLSSVGHQPTIGPKDKRLAQALVKAPRDSHAKMCRVIQVWLDIKATLKWWKQFDTYKIGTTALSTSTMNSIMSRALTTADFTPLVDVSIIAKVNRMILAGDEQRVFANLPLDYLQLRGVCLNYQVLRNMWLDRRHHKLDEWRTFLDAIRAQCPYAEELIFCE